MALTYLGWEWFSVVSLEIFLVASISLCFPAWVHRSRSYGGFSSPLACIRDVIRTDGLGGFGPHLLPGGRTECI